MCKETLLLFFLINYLARNDVGTGGKVILRCKILGGWNLSLLLSVFPDMHTSSKAFLKDVQISPR